MSILYRSPNLIVDAHEWHVVVRKKDGHIFRRYMFRPLTSTAWKPITNWQGPRPKQLNNRLARFLRHAEFAMGSEKARAQAVAKLPRVPTGAMQLNR
ncbi:hypothetical protein ACRAVF_19180 [Bradyrhizobium oligotrophicum S58]